MINLETLGFVWYTVKAIYVLLRKRTLIASICRDFGNSSLIALPNYSKGVFIQNIEFTDQINLISYVPEDKLYHVYFSSVGFYLLLFII